MERICTRALRVFGVVAHSPQHSSHDTQNPAFTSLMHMLILFPARARQTTPALAALVRSCQEQSQLGAQATGTAGAGQQGAQAAGGRVKGAGEGSKGFAATQLAPASLARMFTSVGALLARVREPKPTQPRMSEEEDEGEEEELRLTQPRKKGRRVGRRGDKGRVWGSDGSGGVEEGGQVPEEEGKTRIPPPGVLSASSSGDEGEVGVRRMPRGRRGRKRGRQGRGSQGTSQDAGVNEGEEQDGACAHVAPRRGDQSQINWRALSGSSDSSEEK